MSFHHAPIFHTEILVKWWVQWLKWAVCWLGGPTHLRDHQGVWVVEGASWCTGGQEFQSPEAFRELVLRCPMVLETWVRKLLGYKFEVGCPTKMAARYSKLAGQCANFAKFCSVSSLIRWIFSSCNSWHFLFWAEFSPQKSQNPKKPSIFYRKILFSTKNIEELSFNCGYSCSAACSRCWCPAMTRIKKSRPLEEWKSTPVWLPEISKVNKTPRWQKLNMSDPNWSWYIFWLCIYIIYTHRIWYVCIQLYGLRHILYLHDGLTHSSLSSLPLPHKSKHWIFQLERERQRSGPRKTQGLKVMDQAFSALHRQVGDTLHCNKKGHGANWIGAVYSKGKDEGIWHFIVYIV